MKKIFFITIFIFSFGLFNNISFAHEAIEDTTTVLDGHTAREEAEGKAVWEKLQAKELVCKDLSDDNFGTLGEYFMGQMIGTTHEAMNNMMIQMMSEEGEEQMHVIMGKRLSGCDTFAVFPSQGVGFMPMLQMMTVGSPLSFFSSFSLPTMILWWFVIIAGIIALIKWLVGQSYGSHNHKKSPLEILKERYAKGEIDKKEFEDKKKDLI